MTIPVLQHSMKHRLNNLYTWGANTFGQLGDNASVARSAPNQVGLPFSWIAVSAGAQHCLAIRSDGALFAWGENANGNLGDGTVISRSSPVQIGASSWLAIAGGNGNTAHSMGLTIDGRLFTWGINTEGQLGLGDALSRSSPVQVGASRWTAIATDAASTTSYAIRVGGSLFAWGRGDDGELGNGLSGVSNKLSSPVQIGLSNWWKVAAGSRFALGITMSGLLFAWGLNANGQLAQITNLTNRSSPVAIGALSWQAVCGGLQRAAAIRSDGRLFTWGENSAGALGDGTVISRSSPVVIGTSSWTSVAAGNSGMLALRLDGILFTWGLGTSGQLGNAADTSRSSPVQVAGLTKWSQADIGANYAVGLAYVPPPSAPPVSGLLYAWGANTNGELGLGDTLAKLSPSPVGALSWKQVAYGAGHSAMLRSDGMLFTCGGNANGQLGIGIAGVGTTFRSSPVQIGSSSWIAVSVGNLHTAAVRVDGTLWAWGENTTGQLGQGNTIHRSSPVQVGLLTDWTAVACGALFTLGLRDPGVLYAWGRGDHGQLGNGAAAITNTSPIAVDGTLYRKIAGSTSSGGGFAAGITIDNKLFMWGFNTDGELADGTIVSRSRPTQVPGQWSDIALGDFSSYGIRTDGTLWSWGWNNLGRLGVNLAPASLAATSSPIQIGTSSWTAITAGGAFAHAIRVGGNLFGWGGNTNNQVGDGTGTNRSSPVQVGGAVSWQAVGRPHGAGGGGGGGFGIRN